MHKKQILRISLFCALFASTVFLLRIGGSNNLIASLAQLPGLADTPEKGAFVDLVKALDDEYTGGKITIEIYPMARSINNVIEGNADFHIPVFVNPVVPVSKLPFRYISERIGKTSFVLYSNIDKPITVKMINDAIARGGKFPYKIETAHGIEGNYNFPLLPAKDIEQSLRKVGAGRIDAMLWAQEEADTVLRELKIKTILRSHMIDFEDTILIQKGPAGDRIDKILSEAVRKLRKSGRLQVLWAKVHRPYNDWQPSRMGW